MTLQTAGGMERVGGGWWRGVALEISKNQEGEISAMRIEIARANIFNEYFVNYSLSGEWITY